VMEISYCVNFNLYRQGFQTKLRVFPFSVSISDPISVSVFTFHLFRLDCSMKSLLTMISNSP
jgi:hypothetical protein